MSYRDLLYTNKKNGSNGSLDSPRYAKDTLKTTSINGVFRFKPIKQEKQNSLSLQ